MEMILEMFQHFYNITMLDAKKLEDAAAIEAITEALAKGTEAFAAQRMNRGIQHALAGQNIENI